MHILPWAQKLPSAAEQEDHAASTAEAASMQNDNRVVHFATSPSSVPNRSKLIRNVFAATTLLLPVLFVYFCLSSRSKGKPPGLLRRRLASIGDDGTNIFGFRQSAEECEQFLSANIPVYDENTVGRTYSAAAWEELPPTENNRESRLRKRKSPIDGEGYWEMQDPWMLDTLPSTQVADSPDPFMELQPPSKKRTSAPAGNFSDHLHATPNEFMSNRKLELSGTAEETMAEFGSTMMPGNPNSWPFNSLLDVEDASPDCVSEQNNGEVKLSDVARGTSGEGAAVLSCELGEQGIQGADILELENFLESYNLPPNHCPEAANTEPLQELPAFLPPSHIPDPTSHDIRLNSQKSVNATLCSNYESTSDELLLTLLMELEYYLPGGTVEQQNSNGQHLDFALDSSREEGIGLPFDALTNQGIQDIQNAGVLQPDETVGSNYLISGQCDGDAVSMAPLQGLPPYSLPPRIPESTSQEKDLRSKQNVGAMLCGGPKARECDEWFAQLDQLGNSSPSSAVEQQNSRNLHPRLALDSSRKEAVGLPFDELANEGSQGIQNAGILQPGETAGSKYLFSGQCKGEAVNMAPLQGLPPYPLPSHIPHSTFRNVGCEVCRLPSRIPDSTYPDLECKVRDNCEQGGSPYSGDTLTASPFEELSSEENIDTMCGELKSREGDKWLAHLLDQMGNSSPNIAVGQKNSRNLLPGFAVGSSGNGGFGSDPSLLANHSTQGVGILQSGRSSEKHHFIPGQDYGQVVNVMMPVQGSAPPLVPPYVPDFTTHDSAPNAQQNVLLGSSIEPWNSAFAFLPTFYDPTNATMVSAALPPTNCQARAASGSRETSTREAVISDEACRQHPYWRLPKVSQKLEHERFSWEKALFNNCREKLVDLLMPIRELLVKPELEEKELVTLIKLGEKLLNEVVWSTSIGTGSDISWKVAQGLGRRFLVADYLWCICEVVGPPMEKDSWWDKLMGKYLHIGYLKSYASSKSRGLSDLVKRLISAIDEYRKGKRPQPRDVVMLKQEIFFKLHCRSWFRDPCWEPWRQDNNALYLGSS